jgi:hypothetical protein
MPRSFLDIERSYYGAADWLSRITTTSGVKEWVVLALLPEQNISRDRT